MGAMIRVMPIIRSRTGCFTCRRRKKKCNEEKPVCSGCRRNKLDCRWPADSASSSVSSPAARHLRDKASPTAPLRPSSEPASPPERLPVVVALSPSSEDAPAYPHFHHLHHQPLRPHQQLHHRGPPPPPPPQHQQQLPSPASPPPPPPKRRMLAPASSYPLTRPGSSTAARFFDLADTEPDAVAAADIIDSSRSNGLGSPVSPPSAATTTIASVSGASSESPSDDAGLADYGEEAEQLPEIDQAISLQQLQQLGLSPPMELLPSHSHNSYELFSFYLARTANSMGNGSTDVNPFIAKLVPLAFSNPLVLQLILAQSAAHRQVSSDAEPGGEIAQQYYTDSLRMFRNVVDEYVSGNDENTLTLTVGSLILCLTEVARGDVCGTVFDHLTASRSLLTTLLEKPESDVLLGDLPDFLVEYYMHTAASSMIGTDPHSNRPAMLSPNIEQMARALVARKYIGQLCGCWLELLLLIPQIFQLGKTMLPPVNAEPRTKQVSADDIITFGFLQSQILAFTPPQSASLYSQLAGLVFKQGVLLYLWSILGLPDQHDAQGAHRCLIEGAVSEAVSLLSTFPASARVNTSLCWPLAVIGCCTSDPDTRDVLRTRLQTMIDTIGLGNMRETLILLEHVWRQPVDETTPWSLYKSMQEHQIWISFA
ncbi:hypothetical protein CDD83_3629 [Cordyceps sp. RAO-2017]|nr:hypothetical protein CDD83_3629 [Cordyceps sp. RAO-2017]